MYYIPHSYNKAREKKVLLRKEEKIRLQHCTLFIYTISVCQLFESCIISLYLINISPMIENAVDIIHIMNRCQK